MGETQKIDYSCFPPSQIAGTITNYHTICYIFSSSFFGRWRCLGQLTLHSPQLISFSIRSKADHPHRKLVFITAWSQELNPGRLCREQTHQPTPLSLGASIFYIFIHLSNLTGPRKWSLCFNWHSRFFFFWLNNRIYINQDNKVLGYDPFIVIREITSNSRENSK